MPPGDYRYCACSRLHSLRGFERKRLWVLKNSVIRADLGWAGVGAAEFFFSFLGGEDQRWGWRAEEAHQLLDVLRSRRQKELLPNELHAS